MGSKAERSKPVIASTEDSGCLTLLGLRDKHHSLKKPGSSSLQSGAGILRPSCRRVCPEAFLLGLERAVLLLPSHNIVPLCLCPWCVFVFPNIKNLIYL